MSEMNPYQPPVAAAAGATHDRFNAAGRSLDAGRGWNWITAAFALFMKQPGMWVLLFIIYLLCAVVLAVIPILGGIANMLLYPVFGAGFMLICRALDNDEEIEIAHLFAGFKEKTGDLMMVGVLSVVAIVVVVVPALLIAGGAGIFAGMQGGVTAIMAMGATLLLVSMLVLALSIPIYMAMWFAAPLVIFHGLKPAEALKASFFGCLKNLAPTLLYGIVLLVLFVLAVITFGLGFLVLGPVVIASIYTAYREIYFDA